MQPKTSSVARGGAGGAAAPPETILAKCGPFRNLFMAPKKYRYRRYASQTEPKSGVPICFRTNKFSDRSTFNWASPSIAVLSVDVGLCKYGRTESVERRDRQH